MSRLVCTAAIPLALGAFAICTATASAAPSIAPPTVSHVSTESARLEAGITTNGKTTTWHFEYGPADCSSNSCTSTPIPDAKISGALELANVKAELEGLTPATTYHFRVVAKNSEGTEQTLDRTFRTASIPSPPEQTFGPCPNDAFRTDHPSAKLPDCRAYEQASPVDKNGLDAIGQVAWVKASKDGDRVSFLTTGGVPGGEGAQELPAYLSSRGPFDWSTQGLLPPASLGGDAKVIGWIADFSQSYGFATEFGAGNIEGTLVERSSTDGSLRTIVPFGAGLEDKPAFVGTGADGTEALFESGSALLPGAQPGKSNVYLWDSESDDLFLAAALNDEEAPPQGAFAGAYDWVRDKNFTSAGGSQSNYYTQDNHAIASDGSLYFTEAKTGRLYLRRNPTEQQSHLSEGKCTEADKACTVLVSASHRSSPDPAGTQPAAFMTATPDGSKAFFTSSEELTNEANTGPVQDPPRIVRADVTDGDPIEAGFLPAAATGIAVDASYVYWANPVKDSIGRATIEGEDADEEWIVGADNPQYVAVDSEHVYWTNAAKGEDHEGTIGRADIDGDPLSVKQDFMAGIDNPQGIAVNSTHIFWANAGNRVGNCAGGLKPPACIQTTRTIGRAGVGGDPLSVNREFILVGGTNDPQGIALDPGHIYWAFNDSNGDRNVIRRYDLDGSNQKEISLGHHFDIRGIAVDAGHVYWASEAKGVIGRISVADFTEEFDECEEIPGCEPEFIKDQGKLRGLALDASHLYWSENGEPFPNPGNDLYRFDAATGELTDVAPNPGETNGAEVLGVLGASEDGSYLYFVANADLDGAGPVTAGDCRGSVGLGPELTGTCNLYLAHAGTIELIARLDAQGSEERSDALDWLPHGNLFGQTEKTSRVSPDGRTLLFRSQEQLTSYDNEGVPMLYRYRVGESGPTCISCNPTGGSPTGIRTAGVNVSAVTPATPAYVLSRVLSDDGNRVFFESTDPLAIGDTNGEEGCPQIHAGPTFIGFPACQDVYEWEAKGTGSCEADVQGGGCLYLLSSGKSPVASFLVDASSDGDDAFFITRSQLVPQDRDGLYDVYDASVGGGLPAQNQVPSVPCEAEACRAGASTPPAIPSPGTPSFSGPPDPKPKHAHKRKRRKAKKQRHRKRHRASRQHR